MELEVEVIGVVSYHAKALCVPGVGYGVAVAAHSFFQFCFAYYCAAVGSGRGLDGFKFEYLSLGDCDFHCHSKDFYR